MRPGQVLPTPARIGRCARTLSRDARAARSFASLTSAVSAPRGPRRARRPLGTSDDTGTRSALKRSQTAAIHESDRSPENQHLCRDFGLLETFEWSPENRGVPGSSPGLAMTETPGSKRFSCFQGGLCGGLIGYRESCGARFEMAGGLSLLVARSVSGGRGSYAVGRGRRATSAASSGARPNRRSTPSAWWMSASLGAVPSRTARMTARRPPPLS
jgi:hypothetical protein